jgi:hypothetical protein
LFGTQLIEIDCSDLRSNFPDDFVLWTDWGEDLLIGAEGMGPTANEKFHSCGRGTIEGLIKGEGGFIGNPSFGLITKPGSMCYIIVAFEVGLDPMIARGTGTAAAEGHSYEKGCK